MKVDRGFSEDAMMIDQADGYGSTCAHDRYCSHATNEMMGLNLAQRHIVPAAWAE